VVKEALTEEREGALKTDVEQLEARLCELAGANAMLSLSSESTKSDKIGEGPAGPVGGARSKDLRGCRAPANAFGCACTYY
jgi:hypothetical protein